MSQVILGIIFGIPAGWVLHTGYLRFLYKTMVSIRRQMRGGAKRRR